MTKKHKKNKRNVHELPPVYKQILDYAKEHRDGFSAEIVGGVLIPFRPEKKSRFIVSKTHIKATPARIKKEYKDYEGLLGGWYDRKEKKYYIDKNIAVEKESTALKIAKQYKQKAYWDAITQKEVQVPIEKKIVKRKGKIKGKLKQVRIYRKDKITQRYWVRGDLYEKGYFYDKKNQRWSPATRYTFFAARGFYRINNVPPNNFFSTELLGRKIWSKLWIDMNQFHAKLNSSLRPHLSRKGMWYQCYRFFSYDYHRGFFWYDYKGHLHYTVVEKHYREKT